MRSAPSLAFDPQRSPIAEVSFALMVLLAALSIVLCALPILLQALSGAVLITAAYLGARSMRRGQLTRAVLQSDGMWLLSFAANGNESANAEVSAELISSSLLGTLTALRWRDVTTRRDITVMLWPDSIPNTTRRHLRVWLRSGRAHAADLSPS